VLLNLLLNAAQAAGGTGRVQIECAAREGRVLLRITDSGPGFTPEALENLFTPFFTSKEKGTGLGLAISNRIVESHSGRIEVDNLPGGGAVVTVELPAAERIDG
jgi:two-component system sensor histidine kinase PilS (NtrC family)